jgi:branched-chain amino acid aminotransferase
MRSTNDTFLYQGGGDEPGPAIIKLLKQLQGIQRGLVPDPFGWVETVRAYGEGEFERDGAVEAAAAAGAQEKALSELP